MRRILAFLLIAIALPVVAVAGEPYNRVVAVVDDQIITYFEIETIAGPEIGRIFDAHPEWSTDVRKKKAAELKQAILQQLIERKLIESEVTRLGIEVTDGEIDAYIEKVRKSNDYTDDMLKNMLRQQGLTMQDFRDRIKLEILRERYVSFRMRDKVRVRDEDVRAYYELHRDEFMAEPVVRIAEIRFNIAPDAEQTELENAFATANKVYEKILAGAPFEEMAKQHSQGPTAADGGVLGEFKIDTELKPVYRKAVKPLADGGLSTIYRDKNGFFILKLLGKRETGAVPFESVQDKIGMILRRQQADTEMQRLGAELRKKSYVDIRVNYAEE
ncbi:MAG: SurA N-terminal domain-containing protein [Candidatus Lernaella stagnicola]|nr:SurA N-terminal domain-containing protein [Candidatus Lernaella stagnicola]